MENHRPHPLAARLINRKLVGRGGYGVVFEATDSLTGGRLCVKSVQADQMKYFMSLQNEHRILQLIDSPYVPKLIGSGYEHNVPWFGNKTTFNIYMELVPGGSLSRYRCRERGAIAFSKDILKGLAYLHSRNVVHCDIKPANIVRGQDNVVLCDFGGSRLTTDPFEWLRSTVNPDGVIANHLCTRGFTAPEVSRTGMQEPPSDIYSFGVTLAFMATGRLAEQDVAAGLGPYGSLYKVGSFSDECRDLVSQCLCEDPRKRPTAEEALRHVWFQKYPFPDYPKIPRKVAHPPAGARPSLFISPQPPVYARGPFNDGTLPSWLTPEPPPDAVKAAGSSTALLLPRAEGPGREVAFAQLLPPRAPATATVVPPVPGGDGQTAPANRRIILIRSTGSPGPTAGASGSPGQGGAARALLGRPGPAVVPANLGCAVSVHDMCRRFFNMGGKRVNPDFVPLMPPAAAPMHRAPAAQPEPAVNPPERRVRPRNNPEPSNNHPSPGRQKAPPKP